MKKLILIAIAALFTVNVWGQTIDAEYLNPQLGNTSYTHMRFGNTTNYYASFMHNISSSTYGDGDDFTILTYGNRDLNFQTGTGNVIFFPSSGGNVGIGTASPLYTLDINNGDMGTANARIKGKAPSITYTIHRESGTGAAINAMNLSFYNGTTTANLINVGMLANNNIGSIPTLDYFFIGDSYSDNAFRIYPDKKSFFDGYVGIGTLDPNYKLCIQTDDNTVGLAHQINGSTKFYSKINSGNGEVFLNNNTGNGKVKLNSEGNSYFNGGNVGIGTSNPNTKLHIEGNGGVPAADYEILKAESSLMLSSVSSSTDGGLGTNTKLYIGIGSSLYTWLQAFNNYSNFAQNIILNPVGGNVAIGTTVIPSGYMFAVDGKAIFEEVKVEIINGADKVFEEDYELTNLEELEEFVKTNKHLPEIANEKEMKEKGVDMGEFQIQLLQKIEELTLYVIELKKENIELNRKVESLMQ
jgi:hypothetical protein